MGTAGILRTAAIAAIAAVGVGVGGCGDDAEAPATNPPTTASEQPAPAEPDVEPERQQPPPKDKPSGPAESGDADPRLTELERQAERTARSLVAALNDRDGARVCSLFVSGGLDEVELPERRGDCAGSMSASIGYRDPRGLPVWASAKVARVDVTEIDAASATLTVTVVTEFADRGQPSIEDDLVYLSRDGDRWRIAKPSSTLYRAVGVADVPPSVLTPP
jgi:hypothetical protein